MFTGVFQTVVRVKMRGDSLLHYLIILVTGSSDAVRQTFPKSEQRRACS